MSDDKYGINNMCLLYAESITQSLNVMYRQLDVSEVALNEAGNPNVGTALGLAG